jgi:hypothetical protein
MNMGKMVVSDGTRVSVVDVYGEPSSKPVDGYSCSANCSLKLY